MRKESTVQNFEIRGMECESSTSVGGGEKNNTRTIEEKETATVEVENSMECSEQAMEKDNSEGEIILEEEKKRSRKMSSSSAEISVRERLRRKIRQRNLKKYRMVRTRHGSKYEADLTEEDKKYREGQEDQYKHSHIGSVFDPVG